MNNHIYEYLSLTFLYSGKLSRYNLLIIPLTDKTLNALLKLIRKLLVTV